MDVDLGTLDCLFCGLSVDDCYSELVACCEKCDRTNGEGHKLTRFASYIQSNYGRRAMLFEDGHPVISYIDKPMPIERFLRWLFA